MRPLFFIDEIQCKIAIIIQQYYILVTFHKIHLLRLYIIDKAEKIISFIVQNVTQKTCKV